MQRSAMRSPTGVRIGPQVLANAAQGVSELIKLMGGNPERAFGPARIDPNLISDPMRPIPLKGYCDLFEFAASETHNDNFGLHFGSKFEPQKLGILGYLAVSSPTLGAALNLMCEWFPVHQHDTVLRLRHTPEASYLEYQIRNGNIMRRRQDAELSMGIFTNVFRHCLGPRWSPRKVEFEHTIPASTREHQGFFGVTPVFGGDNNALVFRRTDLSALMPKSDPFLLSTLLPLVRGHAARQEQAPTEFVAMTRELIREQTLSGNVCLDQVASAMDMSVWMLYRKLKEQGVTFNELVRDTRHALAVECVAQPHIPLTEIALMLGYSELSAFSRAFKTWSGLAPTEYRKKVAEIG